MFASFFQIFQNQNPSIKMEETLPLYQFLEENMDPDFGLLDKLFSRHVLSSKELRDINAKLTLDEKNKKLLDYIFDKKAQKALFKALSDSDQQHIVNYFSENSVYRQELGDDWPLTEREIEILRVNHESLVDLLDVNAGHLLDWLYQSKVINDRQKEFISSEATSYKRNKVLLDILRRRSLKVYQQTITCLVSANQDHIAEILRNGGAAVTDINLVSCPPQSDDLNLVAKSLQLGEEHFELLDCEDLPQNCEIIEDGGKITINNLPLEPLGRIQENSFLQLFLRDQSREKKSLIGERKNSYFDTKIRPISEINYLPLELLGEILRKSYLQLILRDQSDQLVLRDQPYRPRDAEIIIQLASVNFCWFQRITRRSFKKSIWRQLSVLYNKRKEIAAICRNNRRFLEENIQLKGLISRLRSTDCLTDFQLRLIKIRQSFAQWKTNSQNKGSASELINVIKSTDEKRYSAFIRCLRQTNQKLLAMVADGGGVFRPIFVNYAET